jgi:hypothetical protein
MKETKKEKIEKELKLMINNLKKGETLNYWFNIADNFDEADIEGNTNYEIVDIYDTILDDLVESKVIKYKKDEEGFENIIVKLK